MWVVGSRKRGWMVALKKLQSLIFLEGNNPDSYVCERDVRKKATLVLWPKDSVAGIRI